jgi:hypothetical protein
VASEKNTSARPPALIRSTPRQTLSRQLSDRGSTVDADRVPGVLGRWRLVHAMALDAGLPLPSFKLRE